MKLISNAVVVYFVVLRGGLSLFLVESAKVKRVKAGMVYEAKDPVHVDVNKVGPFNNPTETYRYYSLPYCFEHDAEASAQNSRHPIQADEMRQGAVKHKQRLGESMVGDRLETSPYDIHFLEEIHIKTLCVKMYDKMQLQQFKDAIIKNYFFEMFVEDLSMWGYVGEIVIEDLFVGETSGTRIYLFPHLHFHLGYNKNQIVSAKITTDTARRVDITNADNPTEVEFSYSVEWIPETLEWKHRFSKYVNSHFIASSTFEVHWLSIINSSVLVLLLTAILTIIMLRLLKKDFSRYIELNDETLEEEQSGWKLIHGDVFRFPEYPMFFCALVGAGNHLFVLTFCHLSLALTGLISTTQRGSIMAGVVVLYCLTSWVCGYSSVFLYNQMGNKDWTRCVVLSAALFPIPVAIVFMWVNTIALAHGSTSALPFTALLTVLALFTFISIPLTAVGGSVAKTYAVDFNAPTRTTKVSREIPAEMPFYRKRSFQAVVAGFLPFSAIYIELHYIFVSMWGHHIYTMFGILFLAFILLVIVASFITVALLYFQLAGEDHRWWWTTYVNGGMTGVFIYGYSFYFYFHRSEMSGLLQASFFFGYMLIVSYGFFLLLGSAAFQFSLAFVRYIYSNMKSD